MSQMILQYILGFCTSYGLGIIGEPPLTENLSLEAGSIRSLGRQAPLNAQSGPAKDPMPVWLIILFFALGASRYILSYLVGARIQAHIFLLQSLINLIDLVYFSSHFHCSDGVFRGYFHLCSCFCAQAS